MNTTNTRRGQTQEIIHKNSHSRKSLSGIYNACRCKNHVMLNSFQHLHLTQTCDKKEEILNQVQDDNSIKEEALNKDSFRAPLRSGFTRPSSSRSVSMRDIGADPCGFTPRAVTPQCRYAGYSGRTGFTLGRHAELVSASSRSIKGFTLIELLVVVLIIGILAAVAVPQYQKAVGKSRLAPLLPVMQAIAQQQELFFLSNGYYATDWSSLDIDNPSNTEYIFKLEEYDIFVKNSEQQLLRFFYKYAPTTNKNTKAHRGKFLCMALKTDFLQQAICEASGGKNKKSYYGVSTYYEYELN